MFAAVPKVDDRRGRERLAVERHAVLRTDSTAHEIELLDLTAGGCRFRCTAPLSVLDRLSIGIAGVGHTAAQLVWQDGPVYGCAFEKPLPDNAVTVDAPDNIARILTTTHAWQTELEGDVSDEEKLPVQMRVAVIAGLSSTLWLGIIAGVRALLAQLG